MGKGGRPRKYPWEEWLGCPRTVLVRGVDYALSQSSMIQAIRNRASLIGISVSVTDLNDSIIIEVLGASGDAIPHPDHATVIGKYQDALAQANAAEAKPTTRDQGKHDRAKGSDATPDCRNHARRPARTR